MGRLKILDIEAERIKAQERDRRSEKDLDKHIKKIAKVMGAAPRITMGQLDKKSIVAGAGIVVVSNTGFVCGNGFMLLLQELGLEQVYTKNRDIHFYVKCGASNEWTGTRDDALDDVVRPYLAIGDWEWPVKGAYLSFLEIMLRGDEGEWELLNRDGEIVGLCRTYTDILDSMGGWWVQSGPMHSVWASRDMLNVAFAVRLFDEDYLRRRLEPITDVIGRAELCGDDRAVQMTSR